MDYPFQSKKSRARALRCRSVLHISRITRLQSLECHSKRGWLFVLFLANRPFGEGIPSLYGERNEHSCALSGTLGSHSFLRRFGSNERAAISRVKSTPDTVDTQLLPTLLRPSNLPLLPAALALRGRHRDGTSPRSRFKADADWQRGCLVEFGLDGRAGESGKWA